MFSDPDAITEVDADYPLQVARDGGSVQLTFADILPIFAKITAVYTGYPDGKGISRTAYGWRKQQLDHGGQLIDSEDNVEGMKATDDPKQWPAFAVASGKTFAVNDYVILCPTRFDAGLTTTNHGLEWVAFAIPGGGGTGRMIRFTLPSTLAYTDASKAGCTVNDYWGGPSPGSTVTVYNPDASTNYMFAGASGAKGIAAWDDIDSKWWIIQMECGPPIGGGWVDLSTDVTNVLSSGNGGTGRSTLTSGQILMGNGTGPVDMVDRISGGTF